jgi:hypothetical protein
VDSETAKRHLLEIERELAAGGGGAYRRHLADAALIVVPGRVLDRDETVAAMDASEGWDEFSIEDERLLGLGSETAVLNYRFRGRRGETVYEAILSSAYARRPDGSWRLAFHQQTPLG